MQTIPALDGYIQQVARAADGLDRAHVQAACDRIEGAFRRGACLFACGNGGSAANASHFIEDIAKLMWRPATGERLRALSLTDSGPLITALANDDGYPQVFAIPLMQQMVAGDVVVLISGSGHSPNVLAAARAARAAGVETVALTGYDGGALRALVDVEVHVPSDNMGLVETVHALVLDFLGKEVRHRAYGTAHAAR